MFTLDERMRIKLGSYRNGNQELRKAVDQCRTALATNFDVPSIAIMADYSHAMGLENSREVQRFLGDLVDAGL